MSVYTLDTSCVINLLDAEGQQSDPALVSLLRLGLQGRIQVRVTEIVEQEVPTPRLHIRDRLAALPVHDVVARAEERGKLAEEYLCALWPNSRADSRAKEHARRDCLHLASHKICGGSIFVTLDADLARRCRLRQKQVPLQVMSPAEALATIGSAIRDREWERSLVVRAARQDDADALAELMAPIAHLYPNFDAWRARALGEKMCFVVELGDKIVGVSVWSPKDKRVVKLSTFFVSDDSRGQGIGPHLLYHQLRLWVADRYAKVVVTLSEQMKYLLPFFIGYGFRIEGTSPRRYAEDDTEMVLAKHLYYQTVDAAGLEEFLLHLEQRLCNPAGDASSWFISPRRVRLHRDPSRRRIEVRAAEDETELLRALSIRELEDLVYPARLGLADRRAFLVPIRPTWADRMLQLPAVQQELFQREPTKLLLRTDNVYYCSPRYGPAALTGEHILFYLSQVDKVIGGAARVLECEIASPDELFLRFGDLGIYGLENIREHMAKSGEQKGCAMAMRFGWWLPFPKPVALAQLRARGLAHPQAITAIPFATFEELCAAGGLQW